MSETGDVRFAGSVRGRRREPALYELSGREAASGLPLSVWFGAAQLPATLPEQLLDVKLGEAPARRPDGSGQRVWELSAGGQVQRIVARSAQVHVDLAQPFYAAVALPRATLLQRCKWALLFNLLRLPLVSALLPAARG